MVSAAAILTTSSLALMARGGTVGEAPTVEAGRGLIILFESFNLTH